MLDLFFLGIDGLSARILIPGIRKGLYPNFAKIWEESAHGICWTEKIPGDDEKHPDWGVFSGPSWMNIYTGCTVKTHGVFDMLAQPRNGSNTFKNLPVPCIWDWLNREGYCAGVFNMPMTWPARLINGFMFSGFPAADSSVTGLRRQMTDILWECTLMHKATRENFASWPEVPLQYKRVELRNLELYSGLASQVDALFVCHVILDRIGHEVLTWYHGGGIEASIQSVHYNREIRSIYNWLDIFLGLILATIESKYLVLVSDHGWSKPGQKSPRHQRDGVWLLRGPNVQPGRYNIYNYDVAPTILERMGVPMKCDGLPRLYQHDEEDQDLIDQRLRDLGYID